MATRETPVDCVRLAGGVVRSPVWVQMFADVMELPVEVVDVSETGTLGCAIAAAVATGAYPDYNAAVKAMVRVDKRVEPIAANSAAYAKKYRAYRRVIDLLDPLWDEIQPLMQK
jgi:L-xylulokinase